MKTFLSLFLYKRLLLANILIPLFFGFALMTILGKSISVGMNDFDSTFSLGLVNLDKGNSLAEKISKRKDIIFVEDVTATNAQEKVSRGAMDLALVFPADFSKKIEQGKQAEIKLYHSNNQIQIDDLLSSISRFEENIIIERMDSIGLSYDYTNPVSIVDTDVSPNFIKGINQSISHYTSLLLLFFGFMGLIIPSNIVFSEAKEKSSIRSNPLWDKILGVSLWAVFSLIFLLVGLWLSFVFTTGHPSFLKGAFHKYLSFGNYLNLIWIVGMGHFLWASFFAILNHKAERPIGAFGISYFAFTLIFTCLIMASIFFSDQEITGLNPNLLIPPINIYQAIKDLLLEDSIQWVNMLLYISSCLFFGGIVFVVTKKILKE